MIRTVYAFAAMVLAAYPVCAQRDSVKQQGERLPGRILKLVEVIGTDTIPLEDVTVREVVLDKQMVTSKSGMVGLWAFRSQTDTVVVELTKIGYVPSGQVEIPDVTADINPVVLLMKKVTLLDAVQTNATRYNFVGARAFESMLAEKNFRGKYLTPDSIRKYDGFQLREALKRRSMYPAFHGCKSPSLVYIDGMLMANKISLGALLDDSADRYAAAVYYSGAEAPLRYPPPTMCGVLELFSRGAK